MSYQGFCPIIFCKGKSPRYQGKYKLGVNQAGVRTCVTIVQELYIALCTI